MSQLQNEPQAARALPGQRAVNVVMRAVLATPGLAQLAGKKVIVLYVVGRKTGTTYPIPVAYERDGAELLIGTSARWARNLRTGDTMTVRHLGRRMRMHVTIHSGEAEVTADYGFIVSRNPAFAKFNRIEVSSTGVPDADDLHAAWAAGARGIRLTPLP
jgi:hypothetical protein